MAEYPATSVYSPALGLKKDEPANVIEGRYTPNCNSVRFRKGEIVKRAGMGQLGSAVSGTPMLLTEFETFDGTVYTLCFTTSNAYKYDTGTADWISIKGSVTISGDEDDLWDVAFMNDVLIATNGKDAVVKWTGSGNLSALGGATDYKVESSHYAKAVVEFKDRLHFFSTTEDATAFQQRWRYSELGKTDEWNEAQGGGYLELTGGSGNILAAKRLGRDAVAIYKTNSVELGEYAGEYIYFINRTVVEQGGLKAARTIADIGIGHLGLGADNIYLFTGSPEPLAVGDEVRDEIFSIINWSKISRSFAYLDRRKQEYHLWIPTTADTPDRCYIHNFRQKTWTKDDTAMLAMGGYRPTTAVTWATLKTRGTTWAGIHGTTWADLKTQASRETAMVADSSGNIFEVDESYANDGSTAIDQRWDSKDFQQFDKNGNPVYSRYGGVTFEAKGASVSVYYSYDGGSSWQYVDAQTLAGEYPSPPYTMDFDVTATKLRLRFRNNSTGSSFALRSFNLKMLPRGDR